jgi:hypothetical protein
MAGFDVEKARQLLGIPQGYEPVAMMAVGRLGDAEPVPEPMRQHGRRGRARNPLESLAFDGIWGNPWSPDANSGPPGKIQ